MSTDPRDAAIARSVQAAADEQEFRSLVTLRAELRQARNKIITLQRDLDLSDARLATALALDRPISDLPDPKPPKNVKHHGAFVLLCSDWHVGERVDPEQVGGRNEYTPEIATQRVSKLINGARWMIEAWRDNEGYGWHMDQAVVWLGGDLMTGMIHEDLAESNYLTPTEEVMLVHELALQVIESIAAIKGINRVIVPCSWGNHGRDTPDRRVSTGWGRSYEWLIYQMIAKRYAGSSKVKVIAGKDEITRVRVLNSQLRFTHGDQVRYGDGVGGLTIPLRKWLAKQDQTQRADVTFIGHHHQFLNIKDAVVNNCLIGTSPYGQRVGVHAPASQGCCLIDEKYGNRMATEIFVQ